ncbi:MAG TPA: DNA-binding response regulator [Nitrospiraceae bacterium]|nr:MAG: DNA-binding response regulator [Nitrospirae bacterium GWA2_46_11]OGW23906.1 MAG: DNA-binding response regulator [Nitrospirae bacterium GWB2_47_37]HAK89278.1 DNA-binding response regulator [Nitrospiraceae bacterium]HCZ10708.1 DNA-binding response regulator [Nitrospiraceae bacterium]
MRLAIVEDNPLLLESLRLVLGGEKDINVVGAFGSAEDALAAIEKDNPEIMPQVMVVDLGLPGMSGVDLIREIKEESPDIEIIAHTIFEDKENVFAALKAGASGYLLKGNGPRELIEGIHNLHEGGAPMSPKIARKVIIEFQEEGVQEQYLLTHREKEIVKEIENGLSYKEIAVKFNISPHTVHTHIKKIYEKLHAKDRKEALVKARKKGII